MPKHIHFIVNQSEITAGTRGAGLGPDAIMAVARNQGKKLFGQHSLTRIKDQNHLLDQETEHLFAKRIDGLLHIYEEVNSTVGKVLQNNEFPFILAADHGSAGGTIAGIKTTFPDKRLGVVWIDAHGDLHSPYTTPSGNLHGMPLSTALADDNTPCQSNDVPQNTVRFWNQLKQIGGISPKILPQDLVFVGVRDTEEQEDELIKRCNIKNFSVDEVNQKGPETISSEILSRLNDCDHIYISFDVDSMDPEATSHGTGTPVEHGLLPAQAEKLMKLLLDSKKVICLEIVEVNPCLDEKTNKMAETTFSIVETLTAHIEKN